MAARRLFDLTQPLGERTVLWPGSAAIDFETVATLERDGSYARALHLPEHAGTHLDAPAHFAAAAPTVDAIAAERLVVDCAVIDCRERCAEDPDHALEAVDLDAFEGRHGPIRPGSAVLLCTGWDRHAGDRARMLGGSSEDDLRFPGFGRSAAAALIDRGVVGIGIDTVSVDRGAATDFPVHKLTLPAGLWHLEGLVGLERLPARGATLFVGAIPVESGSGAPARVIALVDGRAGY